MIQKYFIAIVPPEAIQQEIQNIKQFIFETHGTKGALRSPAHITLHMPFNWEEEKEDTLISTLKDFRQFPEFEITLNNFNYFEPRVIFIVVEKNPILFQFQVQLTKYIKEQLHIFNQYEDKRGFHPHITIAFRDLKKPTFYKVWEEYKTQIFSKKFSFTGFSLLKFKGKIWEVCENFNT